MSRGQGHGLPKAPFLGPRQDIWVSQTVTESNCGHPGFASTPSSSLLSWMAARNWLPQMGLERLPTCLPSSQGLRPSEQLLWVASIRHQIWKRSSVGYHVYQNSIQQIVSGELAGEGLQTGFSRHGLPPQRAPLDTVYPLREHLNSVQRMVSGGYCEGLFPDTVCWTRLRNTWFLASNYHIT